MATFWFWTVVAMLAAYATLDGFDLGAGIIYLLVARTDEERRAVLRSIGPVWDGNEVWLIAGGGVLFLAFPALYASSFSGFYLPLMIVLWLFAARHLTGVSQSPRQSRLGARMGRGFRRLQCGLGGLLRRRNRERRSRRSARQ